MALEEKTTLTADPTVASVETVKKAPVVLQTMDGVEIAVPACTAEHAAALSVSRTSMEKNPIEKIGENKFKIPHVSSLVLTKIVAWMSANPVLADYDENTYTPDTSPFAKEDNELLLQIAMAATMMGIPALVHVVGAVLAETLNANEDISKQFDIDHIPVKQQTGAQSQDEADGWEEMEETPMEEGAGEKSA